jgi:uncharacterized surface protein with fasciclin (FAS1) repeats
MRSNQPIPFVSAIDLIVRNRYFRKPVNFKPMKSFEFSNLINNSFFIPKKLSSLIMILLISIGPSFTPKTSSFPEVKVDIIDLAISTELLSTLVAALKAGGLEEILKGDGPFTLFAPTNEAFANLPAGTLESLFLPENKEKLVVVLSYHIRSGQLLSTDLMNGQKEKTIEGSEITVTLKDGDIMINHATMVAEDLMADNGVIHIIDKVILPPM